MIVTTLLPTVIHLVAGFSAVFTRRSQGLAHAAGALEARLKRGDALTAIARGDIGWRIRRAPTPRGLRACHAADRRAAGRDRLGVVVTRVPSDVTR